MTADGATVESVETVRVAGKLRVKVFVTEISGLQPGATAAMATAEPRPHLFVTAVVPSGSDPLPVVIEMLKAGADRVARRITE